MTKLIQLRSFARVVIHYVVARLVSEFVFSLKDMDAHEAQQDGLLEMFPRKSSAGLHVVVELTS